MASSSNDHWHEPQFMSSMAFQAPSSSEEEYEEDEEDDEGEYKEDDEGSDGLE